MFLTLLHQYNCTAKAIYVYILNSWIHLTQLQIVGELVDLFDDRGIYIHICSGVFNRPTFHFTVLILPLCVNVLIVPSG